jgi:hypothetical protein
MRAVSSSAASLSSGRWLVTSQARSTPGNTCVGSLTPIRSLPSPRRTAPHRARRTSGQLTEERLGFLAAEMQKPRPAHLINITSITTHPGCCTTSNWSPSTRYERPRGSAGITSIRPIGSEVARFCNPGGSTPLRRTCFRSPGGSDARLARPGGRFDGCACTHWVNMRTSGRACTLAVPPRPRPCWTELCAGSALG